MDLAPILSLGNLPLANALLTRQQLKFPERRFPLDLVLCRHCSLLQITATIPPENLFRNYPYFSSYSDTMLRHAAKLVNDLTRDLHLSHSSLVVEVASNDGYLLQYFKQLDVPVLGVEPAKNIAQVAEARGIPTINEFFDEHLAKRICDSGKQADVVIGNNVLAHVAHLHSFVEGIKVLLKPQGVAIFESAYACETVEHGEFDQIYHEHLCYYSATALNHLFAKHGLRVVDAEVMPIHGGSIRVYVNHEPSTQPKARLLQLLDEERVWGVTDMSAYVEFVNGVTKKREALIDLLQNLKVSSKRVVAYGASAKGSIMLNAFEIGMNLIEYVVDRSPHKQGLFMPGVHLPIYAPERLLSDKPDYVLMLAWNFKEEVLAQMQDYRQAGGKFIVPIPDLEIV
jgi:SAM-dependent methyltransferase